MIDDVIRDYQRQAAQRGWKVKGNTVKVMLSRGRSQGIQWSITDDGVLLESRITSSGTFSSPMEAAEFLTGQHEGLLCTRLQIVDGALVAILLIPTVGLTAEELLRATEDLAVAADEIEWQRTGEDVH